MMRFNILVDPSLFVIQEEGPLTFFKGLEATLWRHGAWNGGYFGVIFGVKDFLQKHPLPSSVVMIDRPTGKQPSTGGVLFNTFIAGVVGGTVSV